MKFLSEKIITLQMFFNKGMVILLTIGGLYFFISIYFTNHFFFHTTINGVDISLKSVEAAETAIENSLNRYELTVIRRDGDQEKIKGTQIGLKRNHQGQLKEILYIQKSNHWLQAFLYPNQYVRKDLFYLEKDKLREQVEGLNCMRMNTILPRSVTFEYREGNYHMVPEVEGNTLLRSKVHEIVDLSIRNGEWVLFLDRSGCYEKPKYTTTSSKALQVLDTLNGYIGTKVLYDFGEETEELDGMMIHRFISIGEDLEIFINESAVKSYVIGLSAKYDTVGVRRKFLTSTGRWIEVSGGLYGWKIDRTLEVEKLIQNIKIGKEVKREPVYKQRAWSRGEKEIGSTYVEINITKQYLWLYDQGKIVAEGPVVTGNPNRGNKTVTGVYMLNYKQRDTVISGVDYEAKVTYWMPFYGNIGLHDASWRSSFGGNIYQRNGSHGCVNAPVSLAKKVFEIIEEGTPIIVYEEEAK